MNLDLRSISDDDLRAEFRRRETKELDFVWAVSLMREYAVWESDSGRARKVTEWHAKQIAERLCEVLGLSREQFAQMVIADHKKRQERVKACRT